MDYWKPRITTERAETLIYLFNLLKENSGDFLNADFIEPVTRAEFIDVMNWFEKAYDTRKARERVNEKWNV